MIADPPPPPYIPRRSGPLAPLPDGTTQPVGPLLRSICRTGSGPLPDVPPPPRAGSFPSRYEMATRPTFTTPAAFDEAKRRIGPQGPCRFEMWCIFPTDAGMLHQVNVHARCDPDAVRGYVGTAACLWACQRADPAELLRQLWYTARGHWPGILAGYWQFAEYPAWDQPRFEVALFTGLAALQARLLAVEGTS